MSHDEKIGEAPTPPDFSRMKEEGSGAGSEGATENSEGVDSTDEEGLSRPSRDLGPLSALGLAPKVNDEQTQSARQRRGTALLTLASLVVILAALKIARPFVVPLVVSAFLATLTAPLVFYLTQRKVPPLLAIPVVVLATLAGIGALIGLLVSSLNAFIQAAPAYQASLVEVLDNISLMFQDWGIELSQSRIMTLVQPSAAFQLAGQTISELAGFVSTTALVFLTTIFLLFEALVLPDKIRRALDDPHADMSQGLRVLGRIKAYVVVKTLTSLATGMMIWLILALMGIDFALLWGLVAFLMNFIPNIGSILAAVPAVTVALLQYGAGSAVAVSLIFLVVNTLIGSILEPRIMGRRMNLSPLVVFVSLLFWGWMWGPMGMLLSVPLTMVIRIYLEGHERTRPFAVLMAGAKAEDHD
ncbi:MAG: AI-2E family transporter [Polyangiaceae bacterium]|nr:AI-2E family transporter [Polyangiaceae bacterium]